MLWQLVSSPFNNLYCTELSVLIQSTRVIAREDAYRIGCVLGNLTDCDFGITTTRLFSNSLHEYLLLESIVSLILETHSEE
mmetsp:Transcript_11260/g.20352  ORF Transcript_11260/g.20352 Transcript_11260/m.20352 type:complete len:81 (-) Transcript_11260:1472-1714(-)